MLLSRLRVVTAVILMLATALLAVAAHAHQTPEPNPVSKQSARSEARPQTQKAEANSFRSQLQGGRWILWSVSPSKRTMRLFMDPLGAPSRSSGGAEVLFLSGTSPVFFDHLEISPDAEIRIDGKQGKLTDLRQGMRLALSLADGKLAVTKIDASIPQPDVVVKAVRAADNSFTVSLMGKNVDLVVGKDAIIQRNGAIIGLTDLMVGMLVRLILAQREDRIEVTHITVDDHRR
jgi:hypothetical protein